MVTSEGGPGSISVAREASPSRWGGCTIGGGAANKHAGTASREVIVVVVRGCLKGVEQPTAMAVAFRVADLLEACVKVRAAPTPNGRRRLAHAPQPSSPGRNFRKKILLHCCCSCLSLHNSSSLLQRLCTGLPPQKASDVHDNPKGTILSSWHRLHARFPPQAPRTCSCEVWQAAIRSVSAQQGKSPWNTDRSVLSSRSGHHSDITPYSVSGRL